jgi:hypothetical protein
LRYFFKRTNFKKQLHIVWFLETERTRSFSVSLRTVLLTLIASLLCLLSIPILSYKVRQQSRTLELQANYIRELKRLSVAYLLETETGSTEAILATGSETKVGQSDTDGTQPQTDASTPREPKASEQPLPKAIAASATTSTESKQPLPMVFDGIELEPNESSGTTVRFSLSATPEALGKTLAGRVCAIATTKVAPGEKSSIVSYPNDTSSFVTKSDCPRGLLVKFSRLRPTEVMLPVAPEEILFLELRFTEEGTTLTNRIKYDNR